MFTVYATVIGFKQQMSRSNYSYPLVSVARRVYHYRPTFEVVLKPIENQFGFNTSVKTATFDQSTSSKNQKFPRFKFLQFSLNPQEPRFPALSLLAKKNIK